MIRYLPVTLFLLLVAGAAILGDRMPVETSNIDIAREQSEVKSGGSGEALAACQTAVRNRARYPSKTEFYVFDTTITEMPGIGWQVTGAVDFMNRFGAMIPHRFLCETSVDGRTVLISSLNEG